MSEESEYSEYRFFSKDCPSGAYGERLSSAIISEISRLPGVETICELGCGNGYLSNRLARCGYKVTGLDASSSGIAIATEHREPNANFIRSKLAPSLPDLLGHEKFDLVVSSEVIEHLYSPATLISEAAGLLRGGGHLVITTPYHGYAKYLALSLLGRMDSHLNPLWAGGHIKFFSVKSLSALLRSENFDVVGFSFCGRLAFLWKNMICIAKPVA